MFWFFVIIFLCGLLSLLEWLWDFINGEVKEIVFVSGLMRVKIRIGADAAEIEGFMLKSTKFCVFLGLKHVLNDHREFKG